MQHPAAVQRRNTTMIAVGLACLAGAGLLYWRMAPPDDDAGDALSDGQDAGAGGEAPLGDAGEAPTGPAPTYVGKARCAECHEDAAAAYAGSDHDRAIEVPSEASVEAPFDGRAFVDRGIETTFRRSASVEGEAPRYLVRTEGPDGALRDYPVAWTFGVEPLQQYLLDVGGGRLQCLAVAWDSRPEADGGQRFYALYPDERIAPGDPLHWTAPMQNWNYVCADCHSTAFEKRYDLETHTFDSTWAELDVACEACHGPGSNHVAWAEAGGSAGVQGADASTGLVIDLSNERDWVISAATHNAAPQPEATHGEVDTCAPCHSRRHQIAEVRHPDQPLLDFYRPAFLEAGLYHPDGQIDGEVYVYASFTQSRMFHAGVRCSDCHDPHTLSIREQGNALCAGCHDAETFDTPAHHHHAAGSEGAACVECHMPNQVYMGVDPRRDHSLRIPRPDLSVSLGAPNACNACHEDQDTAWAVGHFEQWWPGERPAHFGLVLAAGRRGDPEALPKLVALAENIGEPAIVRGTALLLLEGYGEAARAALTEGATNADPLIRLGAVLGGRGLPPGPRLGAVASLLTDPLRVLRIEAARALSVIPPSALRDDIGEDLERARDELVEAEMLHADRADAWLRMGVIETDRGRLEEAEAALRQALDVDPGTNPARVNLADFARNRGDEEAAERWLREALELDANDAEAMHGLGLLEIRTGRADDAVGHLLRAAELRPGTPRFAYVAAVALWEQGRQPEARAAVEEALRRHPFDTNLLEAQRAYAAAR